MILAILTVFLLGCSSGGGDDAAGAGTVPAAPTLYYSSMYPEGSITIISGWSSVSNATKYAVQRSTSADFANAVILPALTVNSVYYTYADRTASLASTYYYRVRAENSAGYGPWSNVRSVAVPASIDALPMYSSSSGDIDRSTDTTVSLIWGNPTVGDSPTYIVCRNDSDPDGPTVLCTPAPITVTKFKDTGLTKSTVYYYSVIMINASTQNMFHVRFKSKITTKDTPFSPDSGALSIAYGTYTLGSGGSAVSYTFKSGGKLDMTAGGSTLSDLSYSYNSSTGDLTFTAGTTSYTYHNVFTVAAGSASYLVMPGYKKTAGSADILTGTYEYGMSVDTSGTVTETSILMTFAADGGFSITTKVTGQADQTTTGTWNPTAATATGFSFATAGSNLYMYSPAAAFTLQ